MGWKIHKNDTTIVCGDATKPHPHRMKIRGLATNWWESFVCCNSRIDKDENDNYTSNFLEEIECSVEYNIIEKGNYVHYYTAASLI